MAEVCAVAVSNSLFHSSCSVLWPLLLFAMAALSQQARGFCFTDFKVDVNLMDKWPEYVHVKYAVWQKEVSPTTGREHYQGYVQFDRPTRMSAVASILPGAHLEKAMGTAQANKEYCTKEDSRIEGPWEYGKMSTQGERSDLDDFARQIDEGVPMSLIASEHKSTYIRYSRGLWDYRSITRRPVARPGLRVIYLWGEPGVGKSRWAAERCTGADCSWIEDNAHGWGGFYADERYIIFDEFRGSMPLNSMLTLVSQAPYSIPVKGGFRAINADRIVFTSNTRPEDVYPTSRAWARRCREVWFWSVEVPNISTPEEIDVLVNKAMEAAGDVDF